ncbi:hypothetical protein Psuf_004510 [Phytohabitans suffuscus]|uniref:Alcohol dehydrogenase-like N-terminal domain-containing protein n=1 Tax=Phytohabitans suffuscus TaxID=624315 RepID=A0A6F8YAX7_9ACTN|nr:hypothetical protein Psuf_004510 [Phytohabitans suffuscus]
MRLAFGLRRPRHSIPGRDLAGVVAAVGKDVTALRPGEEVFGWSTAGALAAVRRALTPTGTLIPNSGRGGRWLGALGRIVKARVLSGFTRQQLKPLVSVAKRQDLLTLAASSRPGRSRGSSTAPTPSTKRPDALRYVGAGHTRGKVAVTVRRPDRRERPNPCLCTPGPAATAADGPLLSKEEPMTIRTNTPNLLDTPPSD